MLAILALPTSLAAASPDVLDLAELTRRVLAANPEAEAAEAMLAGMRAEADAAAPWPDPMVELTVAPLSGAHGVGWGLEVEQPLPLWGMRRSTRAMAAADADAAAASSEGMRLELAAMAAMAWADWFVVHRSLALTASTEAVLRETRAATLARVAAGRARDLDVLQVDAELASLGARGRALAVERDVVAIRLNGLVHQPADVDPPPPPAQLPLPEPLVGGERPELAGAAAMVVEANAAVDMARADRWPMVAVMSGWDGMAAMPEHRWMVGASVQVPLDQGARAAKVAAARAEVAMAEAELARATSAASQAVAVAQRRYGGERESLAAIEQDLLPVARARLAAARSAFATSSEDLRQLLDAERGALDAEALYAAQLASVVLRARELELAHGVLLPGGAP